MSYKKTFEKSVYPPFLRDSGIGGGIKGREEKLQVKSMFVGIRFIGDRKFKIKVK